MRILFVDDEPNILDGLRRMLHPQRKEWDMGFANSGREALEMMAAGAYDVVVSDMRMPVMTGFELLETIRLHYPETMRFVLSGQTDRETALRSASTAHQFLSKPCDPDELKAAIQRGAALRGALSSGRLLSLVTKMRSLPVLPSVYHRIVEELNCDEPSLARIAQVVEQDVGMTAKILQMVNSAFFGSPRTVNSATDAVSLLGIGTLQALVTAVHVFGRFNGPEESAIGLEYLERHSMRTGQIARRIAEYEGFDEEGAAKAQIAGILHDVGRVILATAMPVAYRGVMKMSALFHEPWSTWERKLLGASHAEVGGYVLALWGFPTDLVEIVTYHSTPDAYPAGGITAPDLVCAASAIEIYSAEEPPLEVPSTDGRYFADKGLADKWAAWCGLYGVRPDAPRREDVEAA